MNFSLFVAIFVIFKTFCHNTVSGQENFKKIPPCHEAVPCSLRVRSDIWNINEKPRFDELDNYIRNEHGCRYKALGNRDTDEDNFYDRVYRNPVKQRIGLRARDSATVLVTLGSNINEGYYFIFDLGVNQNTETTISQYHSSTENMTHLNTPQLLSGDSYVFFNFTINQNELKMERDCGNSNPLFKSEIAINKQSRVRMQFSPQSSYGGKLVYDCVA